MDSRLHNPRQRGRMRASRAFTPPQQHQYVQQLSTAGSSHFLPQQHPLQHRLSLVDNHFPHAAVSGAGVSLEHCDYAALLAYRQRMNGIFSSHPTDIPHLARSQNVVWPQAQRSQGFNGNESRLGLPDEYGRQGAFDREYRDGRDDLRSLSELDSSRRSAALSAKLFLDEVRSGFQRGAPFEPAPAVEFNRHRIDREEDLRHDPFFSKSSERLMEQGVRKRNREEITNVDSREKALRQRRFQDPGLATLPRTPESSRDFPLVQRKLSSGCFVDREGCQDRVKSPHKRQESFHISPAKRVKKKHLQQQRKTLSDVCYSSTKLKRLDKPKDKLTNPNDRIDFHARRKKFNGQQSDKNSKSHGSSPRTPSVIKNRTQMGAAVASQKKRLDASEHCSLNENSIMTRVSGRDVSIIGQEVREQSSNQGLTAAPLRSIRKSLTAVESTPRSKNVKARVVRLLGSDAKVCVASPSIREGEREGNARELQITSCQEVVQQNTISLQGNKTKESGIKVKQEQFMPTEKCISFLTPTTVELPISLHMPCQLYIDSESESTKDKESQHGHEREQNMMCSKIHVSEQEEGRPYWLTTLENSGDSNAGKAMISSQPLRMRMHEQSQRQQDHNRPLLTLSVDIDRESIEKRGVQSNQPAVISGSSLFNSLLSRNEMIIPLKPSTEAGMVLDVKETAAECEVRLFGKSLKAPVAKVSVAMPQQLGTLDSSVRAVLDPSLSLSQLSSENQPTSVSLCSNEKESENDLPLSLTPQVAVNDKEVVDVGLEQEEGAALLASNRTNSNTAIQKAEVVCVVQETMSSSSNKSSETVPNLCNMPWSSFVSSVPSPETMVNSLVELESSASPCNDRQLDILAVASSDHPQSLTGFQASMNMTAVIASGQVVPKESLFMKDLVVQEDRSETFHEDRLELPSTKKPMSHSLPKSISLLHPQPRAHRVPGRAGPNTWHRPVDNSSFALSRHLSKPLPDNHLPKAGSQKMSEVAAYVRKGNSLVRAPISSVAGLPISSNSNLVGVRKDLAAKGLVNLSRGAGGFPASNKNVVRNPTSCSVKQFLPSVRVEPQETAAKVLSGDKLSIAGEEAGSLQAGPKASVVVTSEKQHSETLSSKVKGLEESILPLTIVAEANSGDQVAFIQPRSQLPSGQSMSVSSKLHDSNAASYVKSKANQLIAALPIKGSQVAPCHTNTSTQELYFKTNTNQLVRNGAETKKKPVEVQTSAKKLQLVRQSGLRKVWRKRFLSSSQVWTLKDASCYSQVKSVLPLLFPWKRSEFGLTACFGKSKALPKAKKGSLLFLISKRLQRLRKSQPVYSRSVGGFAIHRSAVLGLSGANLKWTKSIENRSKKASEEATKAVAAVEKQRRKEKKAAVEAATGFTKRGRIVTIGLARYKMDPLGRTLQRLSDQWCNDAEVEQKTKSAIISTPRRLSYDGTEYVRVGNGHKLVRDPKAATRALANEKVRWSLHTARSRHAKRQQYCLFFTRFGKCNKSEGGCHYIHDPEKVAVCTKFLKGTCSGTNCLFSHKVIPERMPDCCFFLEGLCTNEECPYRHVSVNPKAPICEGFLKGFCADGDECNKKHTTVCPTFLATGECPDKLTCKLHHPKRKCKRPASKSLWKAKSKRRRRYFGSESIRSGQPSHEACFDVLSSVDDFGSDYIAVPDVIIDLEENEEFKRKLAFIKEHIPMPQEILEGESDMLIRPILLLQKSESASLLSMC